MKKAAEQDRVLTMSVELAEKAQAATEKMAAELKAENDALRKELAEARKRIEELKKDEDAAE